MKTILAILVMATNVGVAATSGAPASAGTPAAASAAARPAGTPVAAPAAVAQVNKVSGIVRVAKGGAEVQVQATAGMPLDVNDRVSTLTGRTEIKFATGQYIRLGESSTVEIMPPVDSKRGLRGTFTRLVSGSLRAIVKGLGPKDVFEVRSSFAIASVKGTDAFFDGRAGAVRNEGDGMPHVLSLLSLDGRSRVEVREGMTGGFSADGSVLEPKAVGAGFFEALDRAFDAGSAPSGGTQGGGTSQGGGTTPPAGGTASGDPGQGSGGGDTGEGAGEGERDALRGELADFAGSRELGEYADYLEHNADVSLGASLVDMNGYRVRVEEFISRPRADTIELYILNWREAGPSAGISTYRDQLAFNVDLPGNYEDIRRNLPVAFADTKQPPVYWPVSDVQTVRNPRGDFVRNESFFGTPLPVYIEAVTSSSGGGFTWYYAYESQQFGWGQATEKKLYLGNAQGESLKEHFTWDQYGYMTGGWYAGCQPALVYPAYSSMNGSPTMWASGPDPVTGLYPIEYLSDMDDPNTPDINEAFPIFNNPSFGTGTRTASFNKFGGLSIDTTYGDGTFLRESLYLVSDAGTVLGQGGWTDTAAAGGVPGERANIEATWEATEFGGPDGNDQRMIDILIAPEILDDISGGETTPEIDGPPPYGAF